MLQNFPRSSQVKRRKNRRRKKQKQKMLTKKTKKTVKFRNFEIFRWTEEKISGRYVEDLSLYKGSFKITLRSSNIINFGGL
jgi:hypothetical protein